MDIPSPRPEDVKMKKAEVMKELRSLLQEMLIILRKSTIVSRTGDTPWARFWYTYNLEADEYDKEFLQRYQGDMNNTMIFSGLLVAALATFASMTVSGLNPDPNLVMLVLVQNILIAVNNTAGSVPQGVPLPTWDGPSASVIWFQTLLYASLSCSLSVALGAVLAAQWLSRYSAVDERGSAEDRCKRRQQKLDGLEAWRFRLFLEALPILLQFSLLLFSISLCAYMWSQQHIIALVLIALNGLGGLLWAYTVVVSTIYPDSPYDTPLSDLLANSWKGSTTATASLISRSSGFVGTTSQTMAIRRKKIFRSISRRLAPVRTHLRRLWHVIPHWNRQADVEEASSQSSLPLSPLTNRQLGSRFIQPLRALIRTIRTTLSLTLLRRSVTQSFLFYCRASVSFLSSIYAPITEAHRKRLARSYPTTNDVQMAAVLWLLEVSTDPAIRQNTILVASEVIWPNERFTALFPVKILDVFLEQLAAYHAENRRGEDGMDRMIPLCSAFLQVYWQWYRIDAVAIIDWIHQSGRPFINNHPTFVDTLPSTEAIASQDNWVFHQTVLTLQHIADMRGRRKLVDVLFEADSFPYSNHIEGSDAPSRSPPVTAKFRLRTTTLWYLSQLSFADIRGRNERKALLTQIVEYSEQQSGGADVAHYSLLSMALVLGFGPHNVSDAMHTLGGSCNVNWIPAAEYILEEIESLIHWAWPPHHTRSKIAWVFMIPKFDHLGAEALEVLAKIIGVLQSGTRILSHTWRPPSSHANSLSIFLGTLCRAQGKVTSQVLYRGITDVISIMSRMTDSTQVTDDSLTTALEPVALVKPPPGDYAANETAGSHTLFLQMQCEALAFIKSLLKSGRFHGGNLPTFFPNSYHWDLSQPRGSALAMIDERNILRERDGLFFKILKTSIVQATGTPELENVTAWLDDPLNLPHIRRWVQIAHRWLVPFKSDPFSSKVAKDFSIVTLLRCEKVRQPDVPTWGKEFVRVVRQTAVAALWQSWVERLLDAVFGKETEYGDLVETTRLVLRIGTESAVEVEWYIRDTLEDTFPRHIGELPGPVDRSFTLVESMLAQKLEDIEQLRDSNAKAGYHDGNNTNSKRTGVEDRLHGKSVVRFDGVDQVQSQGSIHPALAEEVEEAPKVNDEIPQPEPHAGDVEGDREADGGEKVTIDDHVAGGRSTTQVESSTIHD